MSTSENKKDMHYVHVAVMVLLMFAFRFIPAPAPITEYGMQVLGIFLGIVYGWCFAGGLAMPSLLAIVAMCTTDYGGGMSVLGNILANSTVCMIVFASFLMGPLNDSGVGNWLMAKLLNMDFAKGHPWRITAILIIGLYFMGLIVGQIVVCLMVLSLLPGTLRAAGYTKNDKYPNMLILGIMLGQTMSIMAFPWSTALMTIGTMQASTGLAMDFGKWLLAIIPFSVISLFGYIALMKLLRCDVSKMTEIAAEDMFDGAAKKPLTKFQKATLISMVIMILGCIVISFCASIFPFLSKFSVFGWMVAIPAAMMVIKVDGKPILTTESITKNFPWELFLCLASAMFVAGQLSADGTGIGILMAGLLGQFYSSVGEVVFLIIVAVLALVLTNFLNNLAVFMTFTTVLCSLFNQGVLTDIYTAVAAVSLFGVMGFLTPSGSVQGAMAHSFELTNPKKYYVYGSIALVYYIVLIAVLFIPICRFIF